MEASIGQLKKDKESSLSELKKLQADMTSAVEKIQVIPIWQGITEIIFYCSCDMWCGMAAMLLHTNSSCYDILEFPALSYPMGCQIYCTTLLKSFISSNYQDCQHSKS